MRLILRQTLVLAGAASSTTDPLTYTAVVALLVVAALVASYIPRVAPCALNP
jgi:hypothetical protein